MLGGLLRWVAHAWSETDKKPWPKVISVIYLSPLHLSSLWTCAQCPISINDLMYLQSLDKHRANKQNSDHGSTILHYLPLLKAGAVHYFIQLNKSIPKVPCYNIIKLAAWEWTELFLAWVTLSHTHRISLSTDPVGSSQWVISVTLRICFSVLLFYLFLSLYQVTQIHCELPTTSIFICCCPLSRSSEAVVMSVPCLATVQAVAVYKGEIPTVNSNFIKVPSLSTRPHVWVSSKYSIIALTAIYKLKYSI